MSEFWSKKSWSQLELLVSPSHQDNPHHQQLMLASQFLYLHHFKCQHSWILSSLNMETAMTRVFMVSEKVKTQENSVYTFRDVLQEQIFWAQFSCFTPLSWVVTTLQKSGGLRHCLEKLVLLNMRESRLLFMIQCTNTRVHHITCPSATWLTCQPSGTV